MTLEWKFAVLLRSGAPWHFAATYLSLLDNTVYGDTAKSRPGKSFRTSEPLISPDSQWRLRELTRAITAYARPSAICDIGHLRQFRTRLREIATTQVPNRITLTTSLPTPPGLSFTLQFRETWVHLGTTLFLHPLGLARMCKQKQILTRITAVVRFFLFFQTHYRGKM